MDFKVVLNTTSMWHLVCGTERLIPTPSRLVALKWLTFHDLTLMYSFILAQGRPWTKLLETERSSRYMVR